MHCELIVPALLPAGVEDIKPALGDLRLPALELLLARSRRTTEEAVSLERWLANKFDSNDEELESPSASRLIN